MTNQGKERARIELAPGIFFVDRGWGKNPKVFLPVIHNANTDRWPGYVRKLHGYRKGLAEVWISHNDRTYTVMCPNLEDAATVLIEMAGHLYDIPKETLPTAQT